MSVVVVTAPVPGISLSLVKADLRVDHDEDDTLIQAFIDAACAHIDGPQGWLGRSIWTQTLELRQNVFGSCTRLPYGPVSEITSIKYVDGTGTEQTLAGSVYTLTNAGEIVLAHNQSWPNLRGDAEGVRIRYVAGFSTLPKAILPAVLMMVADLYAFRETAVVGTGSGAIQMSTTVENLLSSFRHWRV